MIRRCVLQPDRPVFQRAAESESAQRDSDSPIDVFWFSLDETRLNTNGVPSVLSPGERKQLSRLRVEEVRLRRVAARAMLRCLLSAVLNVDPHRIVLQRGEAGKPSVAWPSTRMQFNVSHSEGLAAVAVSRATPVGIDVEAISQLLNPQTLARLCGHHRESLPGSSLRLGRNLALPSATLDRYGVAESDRRLLDEWVREEARRKATGAGWSGVPIGGEFHNGDTREASFADETIVRSLSTPVPGFVSALAIEDRRVGMKLSVRQWCISTGKASAGTLAIHAQRFAEDSVELNSMPVVRSATYC